MGEIGTVATGSLTVPGLNFTITYNPVTVLFTWIVIALIIILALLVARVMKKPSSKPLAALETLYSGFLEMAKEAMGEDGGKFTPLIVTIFLFVLISNWLGIIPGLKSPTEDLNTCLGLGTMVFIIAHASAVAKKGLSKYLKGYLEPFFFFLPMNIVGEIGKVVSHSFRLFGNIFAGAIIFALTGPVIIKTFSAMGLPAYSATPAILITYLVSQSFFGLFVGTVQALVFSLLALTYIAVLREA